MAAEPATSSCVKERRAPSQEAVLGRLEPRVAGPARQKMSIFGIPKAYSASWRKSDAQGNGRVFIEDKSGLHSQDELETVRRLIAFSGPPLFRAFQREQTSSCAPAGEDCAKRHDLPESQ